MYLHVTMHTHTDTKLSALSGQEARAPREVTRPGEGRTSPWEVP